MEIYKSGVKQNREYLNLLPIITLDATFICQVMLIFTEKQS